MEPDEGCELVILCARALVRLTPTNRDQAPPYGVDSCQ